ncbi:FecR domain-containing protein [uncultured Draconibacterium sp.]|uniref:FecR family protein n=1 Tax=uncultured Draconibacterium sp. TaxID=1573823 RepID=UPI002AA6091C|nr:FecR domain-containing protein [uncultured Draconibacterium sp.]
MDSEKLIHKITEKKALKDSKELLDYVSESGENTKEYIRYKTLWAMLQTGNEMDEETINHGYKAVKRNVKGRKSSLYINVVKYAAIVVFALLGGYFIHFADFNNEIAMNEIFGPKGNRTSVVLPDGSKVWLSNGTKLVYPESFVGDFRNVQLEGEGFFEVTHDKDHPFIVNVGQHRIKVLGTKFAVVAYPDDDKVKAELVSGKIQFDIHIGGTEDNYKSFMVNPMHSLVYDKTSGKMYHSTIPDGFYDYWQNGVYSFKDERFDLLATKIARIYNVEIVFGDEELKTRTFTGTLSVDDNIYTLMEAFKIASGEPFEYTFESGTIYIDK